jgi:3-dehydroquinate synthase
VSWFTFPEGEERKSLDTAARLHRHLARAGFHRDDVLAALGGGVVGDLTGYVASTYARGVPYVQVPTTLLAMVDASIGGKTGVNLPQGKNLVGSFHHPLAVLADLDVLASLPDRELRGGLAEVVKYAYIAEPSLSGYVVRKRNEILDRGNCLQSIVVRCARIKAKVVAIDPTERGVRMILNYGHTLGHALEAHARGRLHHGEAISTGMVYAAAVGAALGHADLVDEHRSVLGSLGLPTTASGARWEQVRDFMRVDKKYRSGIRMVVLDAPGVPKVVHVKDKVLRDSWDAVAS